MIRKSTILKLSAAPTILAAALAASPAIAQSNAEMAANTGSGPTIIVTGSRILRDPNEASPVPITSITTDDIQQSGTTDVVEILQELPALSTSTSGSQSIDGVFSGGLGVGQSVLNLRGLGRARTLVLVNGRRHVSGVAGEQSVDINTIPSALIERVDVQTGGASAIYGADAVTGVVNFDLRDDFDGVRANVQSGISSEGDGWSIDADITAGWNFADGRGNITISASYSRQSEILFGDRARSRNNGIADDLGHPDLRFQSGDIGTDTPNFSQFYNTANGFFPTGFLIPTTAADFIADYQAAFGMAPSLTSAEQALIDRAANSPARAIRTQPTFSLSSPYGILVAGNFGVPDLNTFDYVAPGVDLDSNGTDDCFDSNVGYNSQLFGSAFGIAGGCYLITPSGAVRPYQDGQITGLFNQFGGDGIANNYDVNSLIPETERYTINLLSRYEFSPGAAIFFEGKYVFSEAYAQGQPNTFYDLLTIHNDNPFIPPELQALADASELIAPAFGLGGGSPLDGGNGLYLTRDPVDLGPNRDRFKYETWRFLAGLEGQITDHLAYEMSANYGRFEQTSYDRNRVIQDRWFAAIDVISDPVTGSPICRSDIDPTAPATTVFGIPAFDPGFFTFNPGDGQCEPANVLGGAGGISQAAIDFITATTVNKFTLQQFVVNGTLIGDTGAFLELPGGPVDFVVGVEFRDERSTSTFDPLVRGVVPVATAFANQGDLLRDLGLSQNSLVFDPSSVISNSSGEFSVYEVFGEVRLPLLDDMPLAHRLEVGAAARYADYSTVGTTFTWNVNILYEPFEGIRFRATYAEAVRAPNISELFDPAQGAFFRPIDPCDVSVIPTAPDPALRQQNCLTDLGPAIANGGGSTYVYQDPLTARFSGSIGGNPSLEEETATTYSLGVQLAPTFLPGFLFSADYYNIEIENAISTVASQDIVDNCYDSTSFPNDFCTLFDRNAATGGFTFLRQTSLNFARLETAGIDFAAVYRFDIGDHIFTLRANATWVDKINNFFDPADLTNVDPELGEIQRPEWAGRASISWNWKDLTISWGTQYLDGMALRSVEVETADLTFGPDGFVGDTWIHDVSFNYDINDWVNIYGGVNNITNTRPFITEQAYPVSPIGRYFFLGATVAFD
jgi:outer membrane receptor protein involved in Fe transport